MKRLCGGKNGRPLCTPFVLQHSTRSTKWSNEIPQLRLNERRCLELKGAINQSACFREAPPINKVNRPQNDPVDKKTARARRVLLLTRNEMRKLPFAPRPSSDLNICLKLPQIFPCLDSSHRPQQCVFLGVPTLHAVLSGNISWDEPHTSGASLLLAGRLFDFLTDGFSACLRPERT